MGTTVTFNGSNYTVPSLGDSNWADNVSNYLIAISTGSLQKSGGSFALTSEIDFGATYGLKLSYIKSRATNPSSTGVIRLGNNEGISWRNAANTSDLILKVNSVDDLEWLGSAHIGDPGTEGAGVNINGVTYNSTFKVSDIDGSNFAQNILHRHSTVLEPLIVGARSNSNTSSHADVTNGMNLFTVYGAGTAGTNYKIFGQLSIGASATGTISDTSAPGAFKLYTTPNGSVTPGLALLVDQDKSATLYGALNLNASTASRALVTDASKNVVVSAVTATELGYVSGVTSAIQTQLGTKAPSASPTFTGTITTPLTASRAVVTGASSELAASAVTSTELGYLSGVTSSIQTQLGTKAPSNSPTLVTPTMDVVTLDGQASSPTNPSSGFYKMFVSDTTQKLTIRDSSGVETTVGTGSGTTNYISNGDAEAGTTGWVISKNTSASATPDSGFVTSGVTNTIASSGTSPLRGTKSFVYTLGALGNQLYYPFTIDAADQGKLLQGSFDYAISSGTYADDSATVWIYDVTNNQFIQPAPYTIKSHTLTSDRYSFEFQTASNSTSYRLLIHQAAASTAALKIDNIIVGPNPKVYGSLITDSITVTPVINNFTKGNGTTALSYKRVGESLVGTLYIQLGSTSSITGSLSFDLPSGLSIDTTKLADGAATEIRVFKGSVVDTGVAAYDLEATYNDTNTIGLFVKTASGTYVADAAVTSTVPITFGTGDKINLSFEVPIVGWSASSQVISGDVSNRVVAASAYGNINYAATSGVAIPLNVTNFDTHGSLTLASGRFTAPVSGYYDISINSWSRTTGTGNSVLIYKNGSPWTTLFTFPAAATSMSGSIKMKLVAGDYIDLRVDGTVTIANSYNVSISQIQGPSQVMASESVAIAYKSSSGQSIANGSPSVVLYGTKDLDTHGSYNTSTGLFTAPVSGTYLISAQICFSTVAVTAGADQSIRIYKNGSAIALGFLRMWNTTTTVAGTIPVQKMIQLNAGDTVGIYASHGESTARALLADNVTNYIQISRVGNY